MIPSWIKTVLIVIGIVILLAGIIFCYLLIAGTDESRRHEQNETERKKTKKGE